MKVWYWTIGVFFLTIFFFLLPITNYWMGKFFIDIDNKAFAFRCFYSAAEKGHDISKVHALIFWDYAPTTVEESLTLYKWEYEEGPISHERLLNEAYSGSIGIYDMVGIYYIIGKGVDRDLFKGLAWLKLSPKKLGINGAYYEQRINDIILYIEQQLTPEEIEQCELLVKKIDATIKVNMAKKKKR